MKNEETGRLTSRRDFGKAIVGAAIGLHLAPSELFALPPNRITIDGGSITITMPGNLPLTVIAAGQGGGRNFRYGPMDDGDDTNGGEQGDVTTATLYPAGPTGNQVDLSAANFIHLHPEGAVRGPEGPLRISMSPFSIESVRALPARVANGVFQHRTDDYQIRQVVAPGVPGPPIAVQANFQLVLEIA